jgi:hypothetical protein
VAFSCLKNMMEKLDLVKAYKHCYTAKAAPAVVEIGEATFLSILGQGDPSAAQFGIKLQALYTVAYTLKFACKATGRDFAVPKLEGLWWFDETRYGGFTMEEAPLRIPRAAWNWRMLIRLPDYVQEHDVKQAVAAAQQRKGLPHIDEVAMFALHEGKSVQMLHVGPFSEEPRTLLVMRAFMDEHKFRQGGLHHEIYLSDFRKTDPAKLKTILREPVR